MTVDKALWMLETEVEFLQSEFDRLLKELETRLDEELMTETERTMLLLIHTRELLYRYQLLNGVSKEEIIDRLYKTKSKTFKQITSSFLGKDL